MNNCIPLYSRPKCYAKCVGCFCYSMLLFSVHKFVSVTTFFFAKMLDEIIPWFYYVYLHTPSTVSFDPKVFFPLDFYLCALTIAIGTLGGLSSTAIMVMRLSGCTEGHSITTAWIPPATFLSSAVGCSMLFPAQKYSSIVIAVLVLLVGAASFLNVTFSPSPTEKQSNSTRL